MDGVICTLTDYVKHQLTEYPFHNLNLLNGKPAATGGTCFDHAIRLKQTLLADGYVANLHEAVVCITGQLTHRLVKVCHGETNLFVDTGTGWPTCYAVRSNTTEQQFHHAAGVQFRITPQYQKMLIQRFTGSHWQDMNIIPVENQDEEQILTRFKARYSADLPFSNDLRFCWLDHDHFFRIVGDQLFIYREGKHTTKERGFA